VFNIYGLTEAGRACYKRIDADSSFSNSIGIPSAGVEVIVDGTPEQPGEIVIRGPNVAVGYLHDIVDDEILFNPCEAISTGDLGYRDERGEIVLVGRKDHMISVMGEKIHPLEIEALAMRVPYVQDAIAEPVKDPKGIVSIRLNLVCEEVDICREQLDSLFRQHLPKAFIPSEIRTVVAIERTELGAKAIRSKSGK
jgi:acyl-CoA synthetase (AMP-forming)/AMP-acid ligase II